MNSSVSVIIPVRNREKLIERAVRSVLTQTYPVFEIIVVDDGSTDNTPSVIAKLAHEDKRLKFLQHGSSQRAQAARNTGIRAANGEWIAFLDSDDHWLPKSVEMRLELAMNKRLKVVHSDSYVLRPKSRELQPYRVPQVQGYVYKKLLRNAGPMFQGLLVAKEALVRIDLLDVAILAYQEWDTAIRLAKYYEFGFVPEPTFIYDCSFSDSMSKNVIQDARGYEQVLTKHSWSIFRLLGPRALAVKYQEAARLYVVAKDEENARRCSMRSYLLWPFRPRGILRGVRRFLQSGM